jgi:hypothetical protein
MNCEINEYMYMVDIMPGFSLQCDRDICIDDKFPVDLRFYVDEEYAVKIILEVYYYPKNRFAEEKLDEISTIVEKTARDYGIRLFDSRERPMAKFSKSCRQYRFVINPDFTSEQYRN